MRWSHAHHMSYSYRELEPLEPVEPEVPAPELPEAPPFDFDVLLPLPDMPDEDAPLDPEL